MMSVMLESRLPSRVRGLVGYDPEYINVIGLQQLRGTFRSPSDLVETVSGIDVIIEPGEVVVSFGPNEAGETTTLDMVLESTGPTLGTVRVRDLKPREAIRRGTVRAMLQTGGLPCDMSIGETVRMIVALQGATPRTGAAMPITRLEKITLRHVSHCSGGEQQRIKFALALPIDPQVLIFDGPTTGPDIAAWRDFWETVRQQAERGRTVMLATYYLGEAQNFVDRIALIAKGNIIADDTVDQIHALTSHRRATVLLPVDRAGALVTEFRSLFGRNATLEGPRLNTMVPDSDVLVLALLQRGAHDPEVAAPNLEGAFLVLTETRRST